MNAILSLNVNYKIICIHVAVMDRFVSPIKKDLNNFCVRIRTTSNSQIIPTSIMVTKVHLVLFVLRVWCHFTAMSPRISQLSSEPCFLFISAMFVNKYCARVTIFRRKFNEYSWWIMNIDYRTLPCKEELDLIIKRTNSFIICIRKLWFLCLKDVKYDVLSF